MVGRGKMGQIVLNIIFILMCICAVAARTLSKAVSAFGGNTSKDSAVTSVCNRSRSFILFTFFPFSVRSGAAVRRVL